MSATSDRELEMARTDRVRLAQELDACGVRWASSGGNACACPWHDDGNPSAGIYCDDEGTWRFKCFTCGDKPMDCFDVLARRTARPVADVIRDYLREKSGELRQRAEVAFRPNVRVYESVEQLAKSACYQGPKEPALSVEATHHYTHPDTGRVELIVFRLRKADGSKTFRQASPVAGGWQLKGPSGKWPIYNRKRVRAAGTVLVVEGEKAVEALTQPKGDPWLPPGWAATTNPGGAGKAHVADWSMLAGKTVYLWPDNDPEERGRRVGVEHMRGVAAELSRLTPPPEIHWIDCDALGLPPKGDAADWVAAQPPTDGAYRPDALDAQVLRHATVQRPSAPLRKRFQSIGDGSIYAVPWPWPLLHRATRALQPGRITIACGEPGAGKSWFMCECLWTWLDQGIRSACLMLELDREFYSERLLAVLARKPEILDMDWVNQNCDEALRIYDTFASDLDIFWNAVTTVPNADDLTPQHALDWMQAQCDAGCRMLVVDPVSLLSGDKPWVTDKQFLNPARRIAEKHGASLVLVTHPGRGGKVESGSEAMRRLVDTIFWLQRPPKNTQPFNETVMRAGASMVSKFNRKLAIRKARFTGSAGLEIAYQFGDGLKFSELGPIVGPGDDGES